MQPTWVVVGQVIALFECWVLTGENESDKLLPYIAGNFRKGDPSYPYDQNLIESS